MKIAIINKTFGKVQIKLSECVPRVGDTVDLFCRPCPTVTDVCWFPDKEFSVMYPDHVNVDVIVFVE